MLFATAASAWDEQVRSPATCVSVPATGCAAWVAPQDAISANDARAHAAVTQDQCTERLICTGFGFTLPAGAVIAPCGIWPWGCTDGTGAVVWTEAQNAYGWCQDADLRLTLGSATSVSANIKNGRWTGNDLQYAHPTGDADDWGRTLCATDPAVTTCEGGAWNVNNPTFGVSLQAKQCPGAGNAICRVDHVYVALRYDTPAP
jgi:hypothetical protein